MSVCPGAPIKIRPVRILHVDVQAAHSVRDDQGNVPPRTPLKLSPRSSEKMSYLIHAPVKAKRVLVFED